MNERFKEHYLKALEQAREICLGVKDAGYNRSGVDIRDYWKYRGARDIAYMCQQKSLRAIAVTDETNADAKKLSESAKDTFLDLINYAAFGFAETVCREEDKAVAHENNHEEKQAFIDSLNGKYRKENSWNVTPNNPK